METKFDIAIIGGGIAGAGVGWALGGARRAVILEAEEQCGYHSTGRSAAFFLESYGGPEVAKLNLASEPLLADPPVDFFDRPFLHPRGAVHLGRNAMPHLEGARTEPLDRRALEARIPGLRPDWQHGLFEPGCADIDVASLHTAYLRAFRRNGGEVRTGARVTKGTFGGGRWRLDLEDGRRIEAAIVVDSAGAWADPLASACGVAPIGFAPLRRTMVQLRVGQGGLRDLPLVIDGDGQFYFKGEGERTVWLSPHDETPSAPCDCAPEEIDVATAIDRFEQVVDWPIEAVERSWAGLRTFSPDRLPVYGFDPTAEGFFWCAGQGGFGIQSSPAASRLAAALLLGETPRIEPASFLPDRLRRI